MTKERIAKDIVETIFGASITAGKTPLEKCEAALIKLFLPDYDTGGFPAFRGLQEAYKHMTGDLDLRMNSVYPNAITHPELQRAKADFTVDTFPNALMNAFNIVLTKIYRDLPYREGIFLSQKNSTDNFRPVRSVQYDYFEDVPDIDPETSDYDLMNLSVDGAIQFRLTQKGGIFIISRRLLVDDSVNLIKNILSKLARSARRTHARYIWNHFLNNSLCPDGTAWFTVEHGNLGSGALSSSNVATAITALADMTESGSGEKMGMDLATFNWHLIASPTQWQEAIQINQAKVYYTSNDLTTQIVNPCYRLFGDRNERIVTCPFLTDNDWGIVRDCNEVPSVEMTYLNGRDEPDIIIADRSEYERYFKGDGIGYKIRHEYGGAVVDYKGAYKSIVA
jgi:hypothetical protein